VLGLKLEVLGLKLEGLEVLGLKTSLFLRKKNTIRPRKTIKKTFEPITKQRKIM
jgi:hypothetical protein